jgi:hypothetical protein
MLSSIFIQLKFKKVVIEGGSGVYTLQQNIKFMQNQ